jgi:hypothetical protein
MTAVANYSMGIDTLTILRDAIETVTYPILDLSHLHPTRSI